MAEFVVTLHVPLPADEVWARVFDLRRHGAHVPLTRIAEALAPADLVAGRRFVARTALGPVGFDDVMTVVQVQPPSPSMPPRPSMPPTPSSGSAGWPRGSVRIAKSGRVLGGSVQAELTQTGPTSTTLRWEQEVRLPFLAWLPKPARGGIEHLASLALSAAYRQVLISLVRDPEGA